MRYTNRTIQAVLLAAFLISFHAGVLSEQAIPRIVNGATTQQNPEVGALLITPLIPPQPNNFQGICSGTMIGCRTFLTAAHCVCSNINPFNPAITSNQCEPRDPASMRVFLQNGGIYPVSAVEVDPSFKLALNDWRGDIAVLTLKDPLFGIPVAKINTVINTANNIKKIGAPFPEDTAATILGFGVSGALNDFGIKRQGSIVPQSCTGLAPANVAQPGNICWQFDAVNSADTCFGDSGGPMFIDSSLFGLNEGKVVAGVTSAGTGSSCQTGDVAWDTDVYLSKSFIQAHTVGVLTAEGKCRKAVRNYARNYLKKIYNAKKKCQEGVNSGKLVGVTCPDDKAQQAIDKAEAGISLKSIAKNCPGDVLESSSLGCTIPADGSSEEQQQQALKDCIIAGGTAAAEQMLDVEYADYNPPPPETIGDKNLLKCQKAIGAASSRYMFSRLNALNSCQLGLDSNKKTSCTDDVMTQKLDRLKTTMQKKLVKACTDADITDLGDPNQFGGSCAGINIVLYPNTSNTDFVDCQLEEHDDVADDMANLALAQVNSEFTATSCGLTSQVGDSNTFVLNLDQSDFQRKIVSPGVYEHTFTLSADKTILRVVLNGNEDAGNNDIDLYVKLGETPGLNNNPPPDAFSKNTGIFEAVEISSPESGTWHVLVVEKGTSTGKPYQLTVTAFKNP